MEHNELTISVCFIAMCNNQSNDALVFILYATISEILNIQETFLKVCSKVNWLKGKDLLIFSFSD